MQQIITQLDLTLTDSNLPQQNLFTPLETGLYQVDVAILCVSPGGQPTQVQATLSYSDPAMPIDDSGIPLGGSSYTLTLDASSLNARKIDARIVAVQGGKPYTISVTVIVETGHVTYRVKANVQRLA